MSQFATSIYKDYFHRIIAKEDKMKFKSKKGFAQIATIILTVVILAVVLVIGFLILGNLKTQLTPGSSEANATEQLITALATIPGYVTILIIVAVFGFILAYLMGWLGGAKGKSLG
jgi:uncharacterized protein involved in cysteine biosynthesis